MKIQDFDYHLPEQLIAQHPAEKRDESRLLVLNRTDSSVTHGFFSNVENLLRPGDLLVLNDTKVIPARIFGKKETGGKVELLLDRPVRQTKDQGVEDWLVLVRASKPLRKNSRVDLPMGASAWCVDRTEDGSYKVRFEVGMPLMEYFSINGRVPLPAYIHRDTDKAQSEQDRLRYQTVYAKNDGAVAAPTAGLHFTRQMLSRLEEKGVNIEMLTLHVGPGTFLPVRTQRVEDHKMHAERYFVSEHTSEAVAKAKREGRRVIAVGTTVVRTLEGCWNEKQARPDVGWGLTDIFIKPGYSFKVVDALLTNFHLPKSTLIMLVCSFAGTSTVLNAYSEAVARGYRFYSFGDAMFIY